VDARFSLADAAAQGAYRVTSVWWHVGTFNTHTNNTRTQNATKWGITIDL